MPSNVIAAKKVQGTPVTNPQGENLGEIEDVVIDKLDGTVRYAVLSFGGFLGMGDKLFALPWEVLNYNEAQGAYVIDVDKDTLQNAPGFEENDWPDMADPTWSERLRRHYNLPADVSARAEGVTQPGIDDLSGPAGTTTSPAATPRQRRT
ncbi:MAG TPA: PRC-barrel domain-containing protein [Alphaproteobacteria bacterium]